MKLLRATLVAPALLALAPVALADRDVSPAAIEGRIVTNAHDDAANIDLPDVRSFSYALGEDPGDPFFISDPGFNAPAGSGLSPGSALQLNLLSGLRYWDGAGAPAFGPALHGERLALNFGARTAWIGPLPSPETTFDPFPAVGAGGALHKHLNSFLLDADDTPAERDGAGIADGIYAVQLNLHSTDAAIADSAPFWIVYNWLPIRDASGALQPDGNGGILLDSDAGDRAAGALAAVPEPSALALTASIAPLLLALRWRRVGPRA